MKTKDIVIGVAAIGLIGLLAFIWLAPGGHKPAPEVNVTTLDGGQLALSELRGEPVLVTFWATDCPGCVREIPHLIELHRDYAPQGLTILAIAMAYDPPSHVKAMREARNLPYTVALDLKGEAARAFGNVNVTPTSFLIDPQGRIVRHKLGEMDMTKVRAQIETMLEG